MQKKQKFLEEADSEEYLHKAAWQVVMRQIEHAETNQTGALYDDLVAMVFAFHCIEGYLNFVGSKIAPELWKHEKEIFGRTGIAGKLNAICERCGVSMPDKGKRPYSTVSELKKLRDKMAHPKTYRANTKKEFAEDKPAPLFARTYLATLVSHKKALRAREDVKCIADEIHRAALSRFPHAGLGPDPLEGIQSTRTASSRLIGHFP
jgi:hypothetical protein